MSDFLIGVFEEATSAGARLILVRGENGQAPPLQETGEAAGVGRPRRGPGPAAGRVRPSSATSSRAANLPVAVVAAGRPPTDAISVRIDDRAASQAMTRHLLDLGHRRIGFIAGNPDQTASAERLRGRAGGDRDASRAPSWSWPRAPSPTVRACAPPSNCWIGPTAPTAIFASNDDMAAAAVSVAHRRHLDVPRDLTVVGFDDTTVATTLWPPLTTVRQPVRQMAAVALDRLMRVLRVAGRPPARATADHVLAHVLIERESTAPPRRDANGTDRRSARTCLIRNRWTWRSATVGRVTRRLMPLFCLMYLIAYIDRQNVSYAKLDMVQALGLCEAAYGLGASLFFIGYFLFEAPSNLILARVGARVWFARIMFTWGLVTLALGFTQNATMFYVLRFLLGVTEAGFFPGVLYVLTLWYPQAHRARMVGLFMIASAVANAVGAAIGGVLLDLDGALGLAGWQWVFLVTGVPAVLLAPYVLWAPARRPGQGPLAAPGREDLAGRDAGRRARRAGARRPSRGLEGDLRSARAAAGGALYRHAAGRLWPQLLAADHRQVVRGVQHRQRADQHHPLAAGRRGPVAGPAPRRPPRGQRLAHRRPGLPGRRSP